MIRQLLLPLRRLLGTPGDLPTRTEWQALESAVARGIAARGEAPPRMSAEGRGYAAEALRKLKEIYR